ncbi:hypothetical protein VNO77_23587 [Canavalia gladiata]|uniref:Uncharacterized protein n=1 Tax=Canavalia gladiata TaxID=3824 RepID=A0AAN9Q926_CANGL
MILPQLLFVDWNPMLTDLGFSLCAAVSENEFAIFIVLTLYSLKVKTSPEFCLYTNKIDLRLILDRFHGSSLPHLGFDNCFRNWLICLILSRPSDSSACHVLFLVIPCAKESTTGKLLLLTLNEELSNFVTGSMSRLPPLTEDHIGGFSGFLV